MRVLVSGASGVVGYGILRALRSARRDLHLVGTTIYLDSAAQGFCDTFVQAPRTSDERYTSWLCETIRDQAVDLAFPGIEADMLHWSNHRDEIATCGAVPVLNRADLIELCRDKWLFYQSIRASLGTHVIDSSQLADFDELERLYGVPFLAKPRHGYAGKGIVRVTDKTAFSAIRDRVGPHYMIQPLVGVDSEEYTVSAFGDGRGGYSARIAMRRRLAAEGYTEKAETVDADEFDPLLKQLCAQFAPVGPTNFQFRRHHGILKLLEINPRISSATSIRCAFGYNEAIMAADFFFSGTLPTQPAIRQGRAVRYAEDLVFYA